MCTPGVPSIGVCDVLCLSRRVLSLRSRNSHVPGLRYYYCSMALANTIQVRIVTARNADPMIVKPMQALHT
jgi:hypothetical protein